MDLGITGRKAIVCAASKGLGRACAFSLARNGVDLVILARTAGPLEATADEIRRDTGVRVTAIAADITTPEGRAAALEACPEPDILVNNAGGPPPGDFRDWSREDWIKALDANMLTPIELIKATVDGMMDRGFGRIVNITSSAVKAPIDILGLSNGARSGLTGLRRRNCEKDGAEERDNQRAAPRVFCDGQIDSEYEDHGSGERPYGRGSYGGAPASESGRPLRRSGGVWRGVRVPLFRTSGIHHRPKSTHRWRRLPRYILKTVK